MEAEDAKANKIYENQMKEIKDDLNKLKSEKHGNVTNVFKMAEKLGGPKKQKKEAHAIKDPETVKVVVATK